MTALGSATTRGTGRSPILPIALVKLSSLMAMGSGRPEVAIGLIDGPVAVDHPELPRERIRTLTGGAGTCRVTTGPACFHGTFVAGVLSARRGGAAPGICPGCTLVVRPIFAEAPPTGRLPAASPADLADAILACIDAGVRVVNLSAALALPSPREERALEAVLDHACNREVAIVAAAGNDSAIGGSAITRHPWILPVVAYDLRGRPLGRSNLGAAIGRQGLGAPGEHVTSLDARGATATSSGTSVAAPFVSGAFALLLSAFPGARPSEVRAALVQSTWVRRRTVVPPLLDAWAAYRALHARRQRRRPA